MLTQSALKEILHYDPETGIFKWLKSRGGVKAGSVAGSVDVQGYKLIMVKCKSYRAHRLAWFYIHGEFPPAGLDHKNRDRADNRISNLRPATQAENLQNLSISKNNTSGHAGVFWNSPRQKWGARMSLKNKTRFLGHFNNIEDAIAARKAAELKYHQFHNKVTL